MSLLLTLGLIFSTALSLSAQEKPKGSLTTGGGAVGVGGRGGTSKFSASFKTQTDPPDLAQPFSVRAQIEANIIHRVWVDKAAGSYFGYDLEIEPLSEARQFRVAIKPLSQEFARELEKGGTLKALSGRSSAPPVNSSLPRLLQPQIIDDGDTVALEVLVNRQTGVKFIDLVTISSSGKPVENPLPGPARDFSLSDVQMTMQNQRLFINGKLVAGDTSNSCAGELIFFYLRGRGRFVFSIRPYEGYNFQRLGEIQNNKLSFSLGTDHYEWVSRTPVVGTGGTWNLWVLHQPDYKPEPYLGESAFALGAMDGVSALRRED
jgi:hypothetical protein